MAAWLRPTLSLAAQADFGSRSPLSFRLLVHQAAPTPAQPPRTLFAHQVQVYDLTQYEHCPDDVLILGTDGLWDVTNDSEVAATVDKVLSAYEPNDPSR